MEEQKRLYLRQFLELCKVSVKVFIAAIAERESRLRNCYAETFDNLSKEEFVEMVLLDCSFLIMFFLKSFSSDIQGAYSDRIFNKLWTREEIQFDLCLLENQLPFFIVEDLFNLSKIQHHCKEHSMIEVTHDLLSCKWDSWVPRDISKHFKLSRPEHFVGYLAICQRPSQQMQPTQLTNLTIPSVAELHQAGMKFKLGSSINLLDIKFDDNKAKDVEILVQNGILENGLPDNEAVASLFRNLSKENTLAIDTFYYSGLVEDLNKYCRKRRHKWKAALKQKYFDNPWTITSLVAATVLLILTIMQTVCSIIQIV
ncbi:UPF0481 protein At3g47200-like isoform X2 [Populus alba]